MTLKEMYEAVLIEIDKDSAPNLLLEDFNYYARKASYQYVNKRYNVYDTSQQTGDDLHVLKSNAIIKINDENNLVKERYNMWSTTQQPAVYEFNLPSDYFHLLSCECFYELAKPYKCYRQGNYVHFPATRLTADISAKISTNAWLKPDWKRPYYYIHNINTQNEFPYNPYNKESKTGNDILEVLPTGNNSLSDTYSNLDEARKQLINYQTRLSNINNQIQELSNEESTINSQIEEIQNQKELDNNSDEIKIGTYNNSYCIANDADNINLIKNNPIGNTFVVSDQKEEYIYLDYVNSNGESELFSIENFIEEFDPTAYFRNFKITIDNNIYYLEGKDYYFSFGQEYNNKLYSEFETLSQNEQEQLSENYDLPLGILFKTIDIIPSNRIDQFDSEIEQLTEQINDIPARRINLLELQTLLNSKISELQQDISGLENQIISSDDLVKDANNYNIADTDSADVFKVALFNGDYSNVERSPQIRYGNPTNVRCEIRYGTDNSVFKLKQVQIDYVKVPQYLELTQEQLDKTEDTSQVLEFPDYICQEIVNELIHLIMEKDRNDRIQTHPVVSQSIATQQQAPVQQQNNN